MDLKYWIGNNTVFPIDWKHQTTPIAFGLTVVDVPGLSFTVLKKFARYIINRLVFPIAATHVVESLMLRRLEDASSK